MYVCHEISLNSLRVHFSRSIAVADENVMIVLQGHHMTLKMRLKEKCANIPNDNVIAQPFLNLHGKYKYGR